MKLKMIMLVSSLVLGSALKAQVALSYFPFESELGLSTNTDKLFWGDFKVATNTFFGNMSTEPAVMWNFKRGNWVNYYSGLGANFNFFNAASSISVLNGYALHFGARIKLLHRFKNLQVVFEISPYFSSDFGGGLMRTKLGLSYNFTDLNQ
jgi:hypothetical protein